MSHTPAYRRPPAQRLGHACGVHCLPWRGGFCLWLVYPPSTHMAISMLSRRTSTCLPTLILIFPARVHSSSSPVKSNIEPAFSDDHILIDEYGSEYTSTFLPRSPCASRTIKRFVVKIAESRKVAYAATGCSPGTMRLATSCGIGISYWKCQVVTDDSSVTCKFLSCNSYITKIIFKIQKHQQSKSNELQLTFESISDKLGNFLEKLPSLRAGVENSKLYSNQNSACLSYPSSSEG